MERRGAFATSWRPHSSMASRPRKGVGPTMSSPSSMYGSWIVSARPLSALHACSVTRRLSCTWSASLTSSSAVGPLLVCDILFLFPAHSGRPQRFETRAHFTDEQLRLFPRGEVRAFGKLVVMDELHIRFL